MIALSSLRPIVHTVSTASVLASLLLSVSTTSSFAAPTLAPGSRVAIIGDSITEQKLYSKYMEAYLLACSGVAGVQVFQFGWGGETASGFAARLENDLAAFKPTVATTCYGMNDGQYRPFEKGIGRNYETNMAHVVNGLKKVGVKTIVVGSPGSVDTQFFVRTNFAPLSGADGYNQNLGALRDIDRKLAADMGVLFADVHQPMLDAMPKAKAALGEKYDVCGKDGFHPGPNGHLIMAYAFLRGLGFNGNIGELSVDMTGKAQASGGHIVINGGPGRAEFESRRYPFCFTGDEKSSDGTRSIAPFFPFNQDLNRLTLTVKNLGAPRARVTWGTETHEFTKAQLEGGINLAAEFAKTPFNDNFQKLLKAVAEKQNFETAMIKNLITSFRGFSDTAKKDRKLASAFEKLSERMQAQQHRLHEEAVATIQPVRHTVTVTPLP